MTQQPVDPKIAPIKGPDGCETVQVPGSFREFKDLVELRRYSLGDLMRVSGIKVPGTDIIVPGTEEEPKLPPPPPGKE